VPESLSVEIFILLDKRLFLGEDELASCEVWSLLAAAAATTSFIMLVVNETLLESICYEHSHMDTP
jgi:hypothetical protein